MASQISLKIVGESSISRNVPKPSRKIKIGPVQLNNSFSDQCYFPQSVGMLQAYVKKYLQHADDYEFLLPIYTFMPINEIVDRLSDATLIALSLYVWNFENSMAIAKEFKRRYPERLVIVGGPHVPDSKKQFARVKKSDPNPEDLKRKRMGITEQFHRDNPFIDIACHGEGERIFKTILEQFAIDGLADKKDIPSISYLDKDGDFNHNPKLERMHDLSGVPSPYLTGVYDPLIAAYPNQKWIALWETDRGCPYQCTYCDWGGAIEDKVSLFPLDQVKEEATWFGIHKIPYIFLANANFTLPKQDVDIARKLAEVKSIYGYPEGISVQNAKNPKPHAFEALAILEEAGLNKATVMSIQSKNRDTLKAVRRENMKTEEYLHIQIRLRTKGSFIMTDYILPMPLETYQSVVDGISEIISDGQHDRIQFNNLSILPNAEMGDPEYQELYGMELVRTKIINGHGKKNDSISGIEEYQELVIATNTMPRPEWRKTRALCWMVNLIYFNKLLQVPIITLHEVYGVPYQNIFEFFSEHPKQSKELPVFREVHDFFEKTALDMQNGTQEEFIHSSEWLDIWWPVEEYMFIKLCKENKLEQFYHEAELIMMRLVTSDKPTKIILDALTLNKALIKLPFQTNDLELNLTYNVWDLYRGILLGKITEIQSGNYHYTIDRTKEKWETWDDWYEKMVWWGNRRGAYLYGNKNPHQEIAGHH